MQDPSQDPESLAAALERDGAWLLRIARALTRDAEAASDAVQTTLLRAWERARGGSEAGAARALRPWLARVVSNTLREDARRAGLRRAGEESVAHAERAEREPSRVERLELQRRVVDALDTLPEPYRGTLVLRYFDGLTPRAIAAREGVPAKTVHTRIERGLTKLRARLDSRFGDDRTVWVGALLVLPHPRWSWSPVWKGALVMGAGVKLMVGAAAVVALGGIWWIRSGDDLEEGTRRTALPAASAAAEPLRTPELVPPRRVEAEVRPLGDPAVAAESRGSTAPRIVLFGRVLDVEGAPVPAVEVHARGVPYPSGRDVQSAAEKRAVSAADGGFTFECAMQELPVRLVVDDARYAGLREAWVSDATARREHVIVAVEAADLAGRVVDENGLPVADAVVSIDYDGGLLVDFPLALDTTVRASPRTDTDPDGRFALARTPVAAGCRLQAQKRGYAPGELLLREPYSRELMVGLRVLTGTERVPEAEGLVLLPDGRRAEGATVRYGMHSTLTDAEGRFHLPLDYNSDAELQLAAGLEGYGTALVERYGELQELARPYAPAPVVLVLHERSLTLAGRVVDARGTPLEGWQVQLARGTSLTRRQTPPVLAEGLEGAPTESVTAPDGGFELGGLLERDYELLVYDPRTLIAVHTGPLAAGTSDARIEVPDGLSYPRVAGRLVSRRGAPVSGAGVSVGRILQQMEWGHYWVSGTEFVTDSSGRFELADVPYDVYLSVGGENVVPQDYQLAPGRDVESLQLEIALRCHFRVEVQGADLENLGIQVMGADEKPLPIHTFTAHGSSAHPYQALVEGRMEIAAVSEDALHVVLTRDLGQGDGSRRELARRDLDLIPGEVCELRFSLE